MAQTRTSSQHPDHNDPTATRHRTRTVRGVKRALQTLAGVTVVLALTSGGAPGASADAAPAPRVGAWYPYWQWNDTSTAGRSVLSSLDAFNVSVVDTTGPLTLKTYGNRDQAQAALDRLSRATTRTYLSVTDETTQTPLREHLSTPEQRTALVDQLTAAVDQWAVDGIDLDLENFAFRDSPDTWTATSDHWVAFVDELADALHATGHELIVTTPPIYNGNRDHTSGYWVYAWDRISPTVDRIRIMAYDYSWDTPGPIAPLPWTGRILRYATTVIPPHKIELGIPAYGRNWVTDITGTCPSDAITHRTTLDMATARKLAVTRGATPRYDTTNAEATYTYRVTYQDTNSACTVSREAWYPTTKSIRKRIALAAQYRLYGVHIWNLRNVDTRTWAQLSRLKKRGKITGRS